jgi:uncharacterized membrane protein YbhN (UPF0104 family)
MTIKNKKTGLLALKIFFVLLVIFFAVFKFDVNHFKQILNAAKPAWGLPALFLLCLTIFFYSWRWRVIIHGFWDNIKLPVISLFWYNMLAIFYSLFIPTPITVEATRIIKLTRKVNNDYAKSTITAVLDRVVGVAIWTVIFLLTPTPFKSNKLWALFIILLTLFFIFRKKIILWEHRVFDFSRHHPLDIVKGTIISLIGQLSYVCAIYSVFKCFGINISFAHTIGIAAISLLATLIPVSYLGVSMREGSFIGMLPIYGATSTQALLVSTFFVFSNYLFGILGGLSELAHAGWKFSKLKISSEINDDEVASISKELDD